MCFGDSRSSCINKRISEAMLSEENRQRRPPWQRRRNRNQTLSSNCDTRIRTNLPKRLGFPILVRIPSLLYWVPRCWCVPVGAFMDFSIVTTWKSTGIERIELSVIWRKSKPRVRDSPLSPDTLPPKRGTIPCSWMAKWSSSIVPNYRENPQL